MDVLVTAALALFEQTSDLVVVWERDPDGALRAAIGNQAFLDWVGLPPEQIFDRPLDQLPPRTLVRHLAEVAAEVFEGGTAVKREYAEFPSRDGNYSLCAAPLLPEGEGRRYIVTVMRDVTELRHARQALAETEQLAHLGHWVWELGSDHVTWSEEMHRIYGLTPDRFLGTFESAMELVHPEDREAIDEAVLAGIRSGTPFEVEYRILRPDGQVRVLLGRTRVDLGADGEPVRFAGTVQDITERKQAEERHAQLLRAQEHRQRALELNDDAMQGLGVAWLALELGDAELASRAIANTIRSVRTLITSHLHSAPDRELRPGDLVRLTSVADLLDDA